MNPTFQKRLRVLRKEIDQVDKTLVSTLAKRMAISKKMGKLKKTHKVPIVQKSRWNLVIKNRLKQAKAMGLSTRVVDKIFREIHKGSIEAQKRAGKGAR